MAKGDLIAFVAATSTPFPLRRDSNLELGAFLEPNRVNEHLLERHPPAPSCHPPLPKRAEF